MRLVISSVLVLSIASLLAGCAQPVANGGKARAPQTHTDSRGDLRGEYTLIGMHPGAPTTDRAAF